MVLSNKINPLFWSALNLKLFTVNDRGSLLPNIWGLCHVGLNPNIISNTSHQISISLILDNQQVFICDVYAHTNYLMRRSLWADILSLISVNQGPWCCIGDFNFVMGANECKGAYLPNRTACEDFKRFSDVGNLHHILTRGAEFTWSNRRRGLAHTEKRLDRSICNDSWLSIWHQTYCYTLPRSASDHHPLMFCSSNVATNMQFPFRFHKMWLQHDSLRRVVETHWASNIVGCPMYVLSKKLKGLKAIRKLWNKEVFGNIHLKVKDALSSVELIQQKITIKGQNDILLTQEEQAQKDLMIALHSEEEFWREKSRLNWQIIGDRNISYFHKIAKIRYATKSMCMLRNCETTLLAKQDIKNHVLDYFANLYASENETHPSNIINSVIPHLVFEEDNAMLSTIPLKDEIKATVFVMNGRVPLALMGLEGVSFRNFGISLDFRPIALANFQFKIITKVLADRLATIAPKIISKQQRGFIKDRHIHDCISITSEAINLLDHKTFGGNLAIKLDVKKAFYTIGWRFLMNTLKAFGFANLFINWIEVILNSAKLSISVNDVISRGLSKLLDSRRISTIDGPRIIAPNHVFYADDILIFCRGIKRELSAIKNLFNDYAGISGQCLNFNKCTFYSTQENARKIGKLTNWLGFGAGQLPFNYLGVPFFKGKPKAIHV
ncbi:PREDICTED: uncharacterized protein LOC109339158 [Lupinus angustifolius]|uniref:uncharacterized protein LOC109339158 n=1 Tax=Lupinus angustifolius TaxID=3871 RepID=UPI00092F622D|nr:PREDICTED: uncharacterized protein LOC109339158 [Lupinus angustifolius]